MKNTYINLAIRNVKQTDAFMSALGLEKNENFSSSDTTNAKINTNTFLMLLEDNRLESFTNQTPEWVCNNKILAFEFENKAKIDDLFSKAISAGATDTTKVNPESVDFMYWKWFRDINGHLWELFCFLG